MNLTTKILLIIGGLVVTAVLGFLVYNQYQISKRQEAILTQMVPMQQLADNIARAQATWATKADLDNFAKQNNLDLDVIKKDLAILNASVTGINVTTVQSSGQVGTNVSSTGSTPNPTPSVAPPVDMFGYFKNRQTLKLDEKFADASVPFGEVGFSAWQEKPWDINVSPREYKATTVLGTDENQRQYAYNKFIIKVGDKEYPVKIASNQFEQEYPSPKFSFWNPRLYLGIDGGINVTTVRGEVTPNVSLGIMSYGKFKNQPDLSILQLGVGYGIDSKTPQLMVTPITYNIGQHIPLMTNLHVGPTLQVGTNGDVTIGGGLRVGL